MARSGLIIAIVAASAPVAIDSASVYAIEATRGSLMGGTYVTIWGSGFSRGGTAGATIAYFGNDICDQVGYDSSDNKFVCYTPARPTGGTVSVRLSVISLDMQQQYAACPSSGCPGFTYNDAYTPKIDVMSLGGYRDSIFRANGVLLGDTTAMYRINVGPRPSGNSVGGHTCYVDDDIQQDNQTPSDMVDGGGYGNVRCTVGDAEAGRYNISFEVRDNGPSGNGYGQAAYRRLSKQVDNKGNVFHYTQYPSIDSLSYYSTGLVGGSNLTITGSGFSSTGDNVVMLDGVACAVLASTPTTITCRPGPKAASSSPAVAGKLYPGGAGLTHNVYSNRNVWGIDPTGVSVPSQKQAADITYTNTNGVIGHYYNGAELYGETLHGFFVPPVTANYSFYTRGDDQVGVWLSPSDNAAGQRLIASNTGYSSYFWTYGLVPANTNAQVSLPQYLVAGQAYSIRFQHQEGYGGDWFDVGMRVHTEGNAAATAMLRSDNQAVFKSVPEVVNINTGCSIVREKQVIRVVGAGTGSWGLLAGGVMAPAGAQYTTNLAWNAPASDVQNAVYAIGGCGSFSVVRSAYTNTATNTSGYQWEVTFNCPVKGTFPAISGYSVSLGPVLGKTVAISSARTQLANAPLDGSFTLSIGNETTAAIPFDASAYQLQQAILALTNVHDLEAQQLSGSSALDGRTWQITFWSPAGNQPTIVPNYACTPAGNGTGVSSGLCGDGSYVRIDVAQEGSTDPFLWPIPMDWFRTSAPLPGVQVWSNGIAAACDSFLFNASQLPSSVNGTRAAIYNPACTFVYDDTLTPHVDNVSPTSVTSGTVMTIDGSGFIASGTKAGKKAGSTMPASLLNFVYLVGGTGYGYNGTICNVTSATATQIKCTVMAGAADTYSVAVEIATGHGYAVVPSSVPAVTYTAKITSVSGGQGKAGSKGGGTILTIKGAGFRPSVTDNNVTIGSAGLCTVISATFDTIVCRTPATSAIGANVNAPITVNGLSAGSSRDFTYSDNFTPVVTSLSPLALSAATSGIVNLTVTGVPTKDKNISVTFGTRPCLVTRNTRTGNGGNAVTSLSCILTRTQPSAVNTADQAPLQPIIEVGTWGYAALASPSLTIDPGFRVTSISPSFGSMEGGTIINITGSGFTGKTANTVVTFRFVLPVEADGTDHMGLAAGTVHTIDCRVLSVDRASGMGQWMTCVTGRPDQMCIDGGQDGGRFLWGAMQLTINKLVAPCFPSSACNYNYSLAATPIVTSFTGNSSVGTAVMTGTHLSGSVLHVWFGRIMVDLSAVSITSSGGIDTVTISSIPPQAAGPVSIYAHHVALGNVRVAANYTYLLSIDSFATASGTGITTGSVAGGHLVTFTGSGFSAHHSRNIVRIQGGTGARAYVSTSNATHLCVWMPAICTAGTTASCVSGYTAGQPYVTTMTVSIADANGVVLASMVSPFYYTYSDASTFTPTVTSIKPARGGMGTNIRVTGTGLGSAPVQDGYDPMGMGHVVIDSVMIGGAPCAIDNSTWSVNGTGFNCTLGQVPAGVHKPLVSIARVGLARVMTTAVTFTVGASITSITPTTVGVGGGQPITITGTGFAGMETGGNNTVSIGGVGCSVFHSNYTCIMCTPDPAPTSASLALHGTWEEGVLNGAAEFGYTGAWGGFGTSVSSASATSIANAFDGNTETAFTSACTLVVDMGPDDRAVVTRVRYYPKFRSSSYFANSQFSASATGQQGSWTTLATVGGPSTIDEGYNYIDVVPTQGRTNAIIGSQPSYRYLRWSSAYSSTSYCTGMELQFIGYQVMADPAGANAVVNVTVAGPSGVFITAGIAGAASITKVSGGDVGSGNTVSFSSAVTPTVTDIYPNNGTALGGDLVTITGTGFPASSTGAVSVAFNGIDCAVQSTSATMITCITGLRTAVNERSVAVNVTGAGLAVYNYSTTYFRYLDRWSELTTWKDNEPPMEGDTVIVPIGQAILVDISPPVLFLVLVEGEMIFDRQDLTFDASYILVHGGTLEVGTEAEPFLNNLTITLHGDRFTSIEIPEVGAKCLAVMNRGGHASHETGGSDSMSMDMAASEAADQASMDILMTNMMGTDHGMDMTTDTGAATSMSAMDDMSDISSLGMVGGDAPGTNGLPAPAVVQGVLDIHGQPRLKVWTKVAFTAPAGTSIIQTAEEVDWQPGERIVITSSSWDYSEAEEVTVAALIDPFTVQIEEELQFDHESRIFPAGQYGHSDVDLRCEVGLLSRNVVIRGADGSEEQYFGVHTGAFHGGLYRIENTELFHCGQAFNLGRYCIHYHMHGDAWDGYVRSNSVHNSFQRVTTIHGTHHLRVQGNFGYNIKGHSIFVEDGVERYNVIENNLIAVTVKCFACLESDAKPASFWTASPTNFWRNNVAAGCTNDGFWFEPPGNPHGPSYTPTYCPVGEALGQWSGNTAHSNGVHGLRIYPVYTPFIDPCNANSGSSPQYFYNFTSWRNGGHGIFGKLNGDLHHINAKLVENGDDEYHQIKYEGSIDFDWDPNLKDALLIATVDPTALPLWDKRAVWAPQNEYWFADGLTVLNYGSNGALAACVECDSQMDYKQGGYTYRWSRLTFVNTPARTYWSAPWKDIFWDVDGSLTGDYNANTRTVSGGAGPNATVLPRYRFNDWPVDNLCIASNGGSDRALLNTYNTKFSASVGNQWRTAGSTVCDKRAQVRRIQMDGHLPRELDYVTLNITSSAGNSDFIKFRPKESYGWTIPMVNYHWYTIKFMSLVDWRTLSHRYSEPPYLWDTAGRVSTDSAPNTNEWIGLTYSWIDYRYSIRSFAMFTRNGAGVVTAGNEILPLPYSQSVPVESPANTDSFWRSAFLGQGTMPYYVPGTLSSGNGDPGSKNNTWSFVLSTKLNTTVDPRTVSRDMVYRIASQAQQCPPAGCPVPAAIGTWTNPVMWSDPTSWPGNIKPVAGADVVINASSWIVMDENPPALGKLTINGKLSFKDNNARSLTAASIVVWGALEVGTAAAPFMNTAEIVLTGQRDSPSVILDNNLFVGNKVMVVLGSMSLHGVPRPVVWTKLEVSGVKGRNVIRVAAAISTSWSVGDTIVLTPTEYDHSQVETAVIQSIASDGRNITLTAPLKFNHYAGPAGTSPQLSSIKLAAGVGLLSRNVVVRGAVADASDTYGGHIVVSVINRPAPTQVDPTARIKLEGTVDVRFTELRSMGKGGMEHAAMLFQYGNFDLDPTLTGASSTTAAIADNNRNNVLMGNAFRDCYNYGVLATHARHLYIASNVLHNTVRNGIEIDDDSSNATITMNMIAGNYKSPDVNTPDQTQWISPQAGIYLHTQPTLLSGNLVAGAFDAGYTIRGYDCNGGANFMRTGVNGNEAAGVTIGVFLLATGTQSSCALVTGFTIWKAAHVAFLAVDALGDVRLTNSIIADSHIGVSMNHVVSRKAQTRSEVIDTVIIGSSLATVTPAAAGGQGCAASSFICRAQTGWDVTGSAWPRTCNSVIGSTGVHRLGVMLPQHTNRAKTCEIDGGLTVCRPPNRPERLCNMPWEKRHGLPVTRDTQMYLTRVTFAGFSADSGCGTGSYMGRAIGGNPSQVDMAVPVTSSAIVWAPVLGNSSSGSLAVAPALESRFWFGTSWATDGKCGSSVGCDGLNFHLMSDTDGTLTSTGVPRSSVLSNNPALGERSPRCIWIDAWPGSYCPGIVYRAAVMENMDLDRGHRRMGALQVERNPSTSGILAGLSQTNVTAMGPIDDECAKRFYFGQYPFVFMPDPHGIANHRVYWPSTEPGQTRIHVITPDAAEKTMLRFFIQRPNSLNVYLDNVLAPAKDIGTLGLPNVTTDGLGSNIFNPQERHLTLIVAGNNVGGSNGGGSVWIDVVRLASVQLTLKLSVSADAFFGPSIVNNLALLLNIDPSRIKVVSVHAADDGLGRRLHGSSGNGRSLAASNTSTSVAIEILPPANATLVITNETDTSSIAAVEAAQQRMVNLAVSLATLVSSNQLTQLGNYTVLEAAVVAPTVASPNPSDRTPIDVSTSDSSSSLTSGAVAGIVVGVLLLAGAIAGLGLLVRRTAGGSADVMTMDVGFGKGKDINGGRVSPTEVSAGGDFVTTNPQYLHSQQQQPAQAPAVITPADSVVLPTVGPASSSVFGGNRSSIRVAVSPLQPQPQGPIGRPAWRK